MEEFPLCPTCGHPIGRHFRSIDGKARCLHVTRGTSDKGVIGIPYEIGCPCVDGQITKGEPFFTPDNPAVDLSDEFKARDLRNRPQPEREGGLMRYLTMALLFCALPSTALAFGYHRRAALVASPVYAQASYAQVSYIQAAQVQAVYAQPVCVQPIYAQPVYAAQVQAVQVQAVETQPVYAQPVVAAQVTAVEAQRVVAQPIYSQPIVSQPIVTPYAQAYSYGSVAAVRSQAVVVRERAIVRNVYAQPIVAAQAVVVQKNVVVRQRRDLAFGAGVAVGRVVTAPVRFVRGIGAGVFGPRARVRVDAPGVRVRVR